MKALEAKIKKGVEALKSNESVSKDDLISLLRATYELLDEQDDDSQNLALASICHIADKSPSDTMVQALLNECIIKSRIFLYREMLGNQNQEFLPNNPLDSYAAFAQLHYTDPVTGDVMTKDQKEVLSLFKKNKRFVLSAPTSFGKTKLLEEIISNAEYKHVAIIVPTNALLSENYHRLKSNDLISGIYEIIYSSRIRPSFNFDRKIIFVLTPEKLLNLLDEHQLVFDFFVFDEFYKISKEFESDEKGDYDRRYKVFQYALYRLLQNPKSDFYLTGPYIDKFSDNFLQKEKAVFKEYKTEIVQKQIYIGKEDIDDLLNARLVQDKKKSTQRILDKLLEKEQQNLIYVPTQEMAENLAKHYSAHLSKKATKTNNEVLKNFLTHISEHISPEWNLVDALKNGTAFHHGGVPRYVQTEIIELFNEGVIHSLFCTSTLAEGVNTSAKNVVIYDPKKSTTPLRTFDRKNIEGRSGRFRRHFIGNVFYLEKPTDKEEKTSVDFEIYDSDELADEDVILISDKDLSENNLKSKEAVADKLKQNGIPDSVIQKNRFISIDKQIELITSLRSEAELFLESKRPADLLRTENLQYIFDKIMILSELDSGGRLGGQTAKQWRWLASEYINKPNFKTVIAHTILKDYSSDINTRIRRSLKIMTQYFEFMFPKYMQALQELYNFVADERKAKPVDLGLLISFLEYGTSDEVEILLRDAGLPLEIVKKIIKVFSGCTDMNEIVSRRKKREPELRSLLSGFEFKLLLTYL